MVVYPMQRRERGAAKVTGAHNDEMDGQAEVFEMRRQQDLAELKAREKELVGLLAKERELAAKLGYIVTTPLEVSSEER